MKKIKTKETRTYKKNPIKLNNKLHNPKRANNKRRALKQCGNQIKPISRMYYIGYQPIHAVASANIGVEFHERIVI